MKHKCLIKNGQIIPDASGVFKQDLARLENKIALIDIQKIKRRRSPAQNNALHLYFEQLAGLLNSAGLDMRSVIRPEIEMEWTKYSVKTYLWKPLMAKMFGLKSVRDLTGEQISSVYENLNRIISERCGISVPFPSLDSKEAIEELEQDLKK